MLQENKRKIILLLAGGVLLQVAGGVIVFHLGKSARTMVAMRSSDVFGLFLVITVFSDLLLAWGLVLLARARGYSGAIVIATWLSGSLMSCFVPVMAIMAFILPVAVLFTLPDKNRRRPRRPPPE